jgi:hypothetical protein
MSWAAHLLVYPALLGAYLFGVKPYMANSAKKQEESEWTSMPKTHKIDPDLFSPFSPIPYHNNPELKYGFAHIHMHNHLNENQINTNTYVWKGFHNSFDHNNQAAYTYNWTSLHSPRDQNGAAHHNSPTSH